MNDLNERKSWDSILRTLTLVEEDTESDSQVFHYVIPTPPYVEQRETVMFKCARRNFPSAGSLAIVHKTVAHPDFPEREDWVRVE